MNAQQILDSIQSENIGSVIFRYSQGRDSTVGGSGYSGVCEGMCYNFVRVKLFQPNSGFTPVSTPLRAFQRERASGELAGGVFVKDPSKVSPVNLMPNELRGERQADSGVRFSQAARNLDAKFKKSLSDKAKEIITDSVLTATYQRSPLSQYTKNLAVDRENITANINKRDLAATNAAASMVVGSSYLAPLLVRDGVKETLITSGDLPIQLLALEAKEKQTSERLGQLFAEELKVIKDEEPPPRVLAICDVAKGQSGHAIALEVCNPNGPITVLDPNFGLIQYQTWEKFEQGLGKMWQLYRLTYNCYALRRYQCLDPSKGRDFNA